MSDDSHARVLIVGAGCAGISCAMWLQDYQVPLDWVDARGRVGGLLTRVHNSIENVPGANWENGQQLVEALRSQLHDRQLQPREATVTRLKMRPDHVVAQLDGGVTRRFELVVLATGTEYRQLGVPGEPEGQEVGCVSQSATADGAKFARRDVAVVGGGDAGFENAMRLADQGCRVTMLLRNAEFRARPAFVQAVRENPSVEIAPIPTVVTRIEPLEEGCRLHLNRVDQTTTMTVAALFVRIGVDPLLPAGCGGLETDDEGYLVVDELGYTTHDRILAAGDLTDTPLPSVAVAIGDGATVAQSCARRLGAVRCS